MRPGDPDLPLSDLQRGTLDRHPRQQTRAPGHRGTVSFADLVPVEIRNRFRLGRAVDGDDAQPRTAGLQPPDQRGFHRTAAGKDGVQRARHVGAGQHLAQPRRQQRPRRPRPRDPCRKPVGRHAVGAGDLPIRQNAGPPLGQIDKAEDREGDQVQLLPLRGQKPPHRIVLRHQEAMAARDRLRRAGRAGGEGNQRQIPVCQRHRRGVAPVGRRRRQDRAAPKRREQAQKPVAARGEQAFRPGQRDRMAQPGDPHRRFGKDRDCAQPPAGRQRDVKIDADRHRDQHPVALAQPPRRAAGGEGGRAAVDPSKAFGPLRGDQRDALSLAPRGLGEMACEVSHPAAAPSVRSGGKSPPRGGGCGRQSGCRHGSVHG